MREDIPSSSVTRLEAVVFDFGETLIDETSAWEAIADAAGVPRFTFLATFGGLIAAGRSHREIFDVLAIDAPATLPALRADDLNPDARPCLIAIRDLGLRVGIAANQPDRAAEILRTVGIDLDFVATSGGWGVAKPDPAFFARVAAELGLPPSAIAYVGDRTDNDIEPAATAGMRAIFIRRGPWAWIACPVGSPVAATYTIESLDELPGLLQEAMEPGPR
jgi:HAD superfamily hydrolase (TIGR01509 family)